MWLLGPIVLFCTHFNATKHHINTNQKSTIWTHLLLGDTAANQAGEEAPDAGVCDLQVSCWGILCIAWESCRCSGIISNRAIFERNKTKTLFVGILTLSPVLNRLKGEEVCHPADLWAKGPSVAPRCPRPMNHCLILDSRTYSKNTHTQPTQTHPPQPGNTDRMGRQGPSAGHNHHSMKN